MPSSIVQIISPENEDDISSVTTVKVYFRKRKLIIMKKVMTNPIMFMTMMTMTTPVAVIFRNQKPTAIKAINNAIQ